jgi:transcriptional regulator with XRE-family HTH domain
VSLKTRLVVDRDAVLMLAAKVPGLVKLDQGELARRMKVARSHVHRLLSGKHTPQAPTLASMALALGVPEEAAEAILLTLVTEEAEA